MNPLFGTAAGPGAAAGGIGGLEPHLDFLGVHFLFLIVVDVGGVAGDGPHLVVLVAVALAHRDEGIFPQNVDRVRRLGFVLVREVDSAGALGIDSLTVAELVVAGHLQIESLDFVAVPVGAHEVTDQPGFRTAPGFGAVVVQLGADGLEVLGVHGEEDFLTRPNGGNRGLDFLAGTVGIVGAVPGSGRLSLFTELQIEAVAKELVDLTLGVFARGQHQLLRVRTLAAELDGRALELRFFRVWVVVECAECFDEHMVLLGRGRLDGGSGWRFGVAAISQKTVAGLHIKVYPHIGTQDEQLDVAEVVGFGPRRCVGRPRLVGAGLGCEV